MKPAPERAAAIRALLSLGFRPFFLMGSIWAALAMALWILMLAGRIAPPIAWDPVTWHAHAFLVGYLGAALCGFLLTAIPNWTGRAPVSGVTLGALALLWLIGRGATLVSAWLPWWLAMALDLAFLVVMIAVATREIVAGRNWRNMMLPALLTLLLLGGALFHREATAQGAGLRLMLAAAVMMIGLIGGRIVPAFTRNWLKARGAARLPAAPMLGFDKAALLATLAALLLWVARPEAQASGVLLIGVGLLHAVRLARWRGAATWAEPLLLVLHVAYGFLPIGAVALGCAILRPDLIAPAAAQHLWMAGAIGLMTLAVMTRATLGHTGRALHAGAGTAALYAAMAGSALARVGAGFWPGAATALQDLAGVLWCVAFLGFALLYGPLLLRPR